VATSRTSARRPYHHGGLREALIDAAGELIRESGVEGFSLRELARRLGVSHVAVYAHFADKQALLAAAAVTGFAKLETRLRKSAERSRSGVHAELRALLRAYVEFCFDEPALCAVMFGPRIGERGEYPELDVAVDRCLEALSEPIRRRGSRPPLGRRSAHQVAIDLWTFAHGYGTLSFNKRIYADAGAAADAFDKAVKPMLLGLFGPERAGRGRRVPFEE
jgi:AcrR family transcriptional regulator